MYSYVLAIVLAAASGLPGAKEYAAGHDAESAARYGDAVKAYAACAALDGPLTPYAEIKTAFCRAASGDRSGGIEGYLNVLKSRPEGPWARMAQVYLASLLALEKRYVDAAEGFETALSFSPKPWWVDRYDRAAADVYIEVPDAREKGYRYYRDIVATTRWRAPRIEAAGILAKSPRNEDKLEGAWGLIKSSECTDGLKLLLSLAPSMLSADLALPDLAPPPAKSKAPRVNPMEALEGLFEGRRESPWMRVCLLYVVRSQTLSSSTDSAKAACDLFLKAYPGADEGGDALWWLGNRLAKDGKKPEAVATYTQIAEQFPKHARGDDALYEVVDIRLDQKDTKACADACRTLAERYPDSSFVPKAWYRLALAQERAGEKASARESLKKAAAGDLGDFFAHRALQRLSGTKVEGIEPGADVKVDGVKSFLRARKIADELPKQLPAELRASLPIERLFFFGSHGYEEAEWEALGLADRIKDGPDAAVLYQALGEAGVAFTAMNYAFAYGWGTQDGMPTPARLRVQFPRAYWTHVVEIAKETELDPYLLLAVARQESTFRPALVSSAGAAGVMQLMPGTAKHLAKADPEVGPEHAANLESPTNSLKLGAHYLKAMLDKNDGNLAFALASYNAGPGNCAKWRKQFPKADLETFIEAIPFLETRDYVKIVLGNYAAYRSLYPPTKQNRE